MVGGKHRTDHLLAHLHVLSDSDRALRNRVVGQLAIPAERGRIILSARLARHGGGAVVAGQAHVALVLLRPLSLQHTLIRSLDQLRPHAHVHLRVAALDIVRSLRHLGLIHVKVILRVSLESTHQNIIGLIA